MLEVTYKGDKGRFASVDQGELADELRKTFPDWTVQATIRESSHLKAAQKVGGGQRSLITLRQNAPIVLPGGDVVYPMIRVRDQSFPGAALTVTYGLYRQVCTNGLMAFSSVAVPTTIPHYKNRTEMLIHLSNVIAESAQKFAAIVAHVNSAISMVVLDPAAAIEKMRLPNRTKAKAIIAITTGAFRKEDNLHTVWGLYNFVNEIDRVTARSNSWAYIDRDRRTNLTSIAV